MSSGFVSGGTTEQPIERSDDWLKAQQEIEAQRRRKEEEGRQENGKSLYEVLENNKAAKQEAFEESIRLKNQFRTLDDDEIEFLDSVLESTRAKEQALKKETAEQLSLFREQQEKADRALTMNTDEAPANSSQVASDQVEDNAWAVSGRKRKRTKDNDILKKLKTRRSTSVNEVTSEEPQSPASTLKQKKPSNERTGDDTAKEPHAPVTGTRTYQKQNPQIGIPHAVGKISQPLTQPNPGLGLGGYSSDDDG